MLNFWGAIFCIDNRSFWEQGIPFHAILAKHIDGLKAQIVNVFNFLAKLSPSKLQQKLRLISQDLFPIYPPTQSSNPTWLSRWNIKFETKKVCNSFYDVWWYFMKFSKMSMQMLNRFFHFKFSFPPFPNIVEDQLLQTLAFCWQCLIYNLQREVCNDWIIITK